MQASVICSGLMWARAVSRMYKVERVFFCPIYETNTSFLEIILNIYCDNSEVMGLQILFEVKTKLIKFKFCAVLGARLEAYRLLRNDIKLRMSFEHNKFSINPLTRHELAEWLLCMSQKLFPLINIFLKLQRHSTQC